MTRQEFIEFGRTVLGGVVPELIRPEVVAWRAVRVWDTELFFVDRETAKRFWCGVLGQELMKYLEAE